MDQTPFPSAADLGISEAEYARILADLRRQGRAVPPAPPVVPDQRALGRLVVIAMAVLAVVLVWWALRPAPEPEYAFLAETPQGQPVTYSSCKPIQVAVYPAGGPPHAEQLVRDAVIRMRSATGLDIVVVGAFGGHAPNWNFEAGPTHPEDPVSVSWQDGDAIAELSGNTVGLGGSRTIVGRSGVPRFVAGTIALSRDYYAELHERGDRDRELALLLHELGHVFGLDHVDSKQELMYGGGSEVTSFGPGDLQGLRRLGQGPCM